MKTAGGVFAAGALLAVAGIVTAVAMGGSWLGPIIFLTGFGLCLIGGAWLAVVLARGRPQRGAPTGSGR